MEIVINILYILFLLFTSFTNPTRYVVLYILFFTSYLGWISNDLILGGVDLGEFLVSISALIAIVPNKFQISKHSYRFILILIIFYIYGLLKPCLDGNQNIIFSIKSSKSFSSYFFLMYCISYYKEIDFSVIRRVICGVASYFSILYIINRFGYNITPYIYLKEQSLTHIQCLYDSFIYLALIFVLSSVERFDIIDYILIVLFVIGISLGGYFSLTLCAIATIIMVMLYRIVNNRTNYIWICSFGILIFACIYFILSPTLADLFGSQNDALLSRGAYNKVRYALISKQFFTGYGFLDKGADVLTANSTKSIYMRTLSFIDSGYVDLMGKFGFIGTIIFIISHIYYLINFRLELVTIPHILLGIFFLFINITWSVFTFPMGIVVLAIVYSYLNQYNDENLQQGSIVGVY